MLVMALGVGALGLRLLLDQPAKSAETVEPDLFPTTKSVAMTPRLLSLLSDADR